MAAAYPRYRFDHSFGAPVAAPVVVAEAPDPLDQPRHSDRALHQALAEARGAALAEGVLQGRCEGEALARRRIEAEVADTLDRLAGRLAELDAAHAAQLERLEAQGAALLVALVRRLSPRLLDTVARAEVERVALDALRAAGGAPVLQLRVHPEVSGPLAERLAGETVFKGRLDVVPDAALDRGALDASWESGGLRRDPAALDRAVAELADRALSLIGPAAAPSAASPSPPRGEGWGEGDAPHDVTG
ncbi:flagellar assembly protein FliH [Azospirillum doebereinerae]|uniref:flagellar assembly protein FliH n=1 Tax=Azospirillum doebereinerae TaxID=92933 RepID=UPI00163C9B24|nr:flagellar assembly protein FliH [Azospirillum doebereinerae]MCG5243511.1 flagellar assembly protein FliH [Azospirillum doebereinerae]